MLVAIPLFDGFTALDAVGPYEVLHRLPGVEVRFVAAEPGRKTADSGVLAIEVEHSLDSAAEPEVVLVPGGPGTRDADHSALLEWLRHAGSTSRYTTSVCTGSLLLGMAGLLDGLPAVTHWLFMDRLRELGAEPREERFVESGKVITAAGVSAGIDMALLLAERLVDAEAAQSVQLAIEYDPHPPFDAGSPRTAPGEIVERVRAAAERSGEA